MKKGISPLIAVVLLVGLAVSLAILLMNFFDVFSQDRIEDIDEDALKRDLCTDKTWIVLEGYCIQISAVKTDLHIGIENNGVYPIEEIFFRIVRVDDPSSTLSHTYSTRIQSYGIGAFTITDASTLPGDYNVILEKRLDYNGTILNCDPIESELELSSCRIGPP
jgi:flagellin-like protein